MQNNTAQLKRSDLSLVKDLAYRIWPVSYAVVITEHQINYMLDLMYSTKKLEKILMKGNNFMDILKMKNYLDLLPLKIITRATGK